MVRTGTATVQGNRIQLHGLRDISKELTAWGDKDLNREFANDLKAAAASVAGRANSNAPTGTRPPGPGGRYAGSFRIDGGRSGVFLRTTDPLGPIKDFMLPKNAPGRGLASAWGKPSRAAIPAIDQEIDGIVNDLEAAVTRVLEQAFARFS